MLLQREAGDARMARLLFLGQGWLPGEVRMADLQDVMMFCIFYSGFVIYSLWITLAKTPMTIKKGQRVD